MRSSSLKKLISLFSIGLMGIVGMSAQDIVTVAKNGNVYDEANAKYITVNQNNDDVSVIPGMVFNSSEHLPGWYKVEYSPGLHAFIPEGIVASSFNTVVPGTYDIQNHPGLKLTAENSGDSWNATVNGNVYKGKDIQNVIVFYNDNNSIAYSLVDLGNGPVVIDYDNSVTKFF